MKMRIHSKTIMLQTFLLTGLLFAITSCMDNQKTKDNKDAAEKQNEAKFDNTGKENDAQFLVNAAELYMKEIKLGQLAQQKSKMPDVKALGKMMEEDHTKTLTSVTALAKQKTITIPASLTENGSDAHKKLNDMSAKDFDKAYCDMMVNGHKDALVMFEKASVECKDAEIKAWASDKLHHLQMHLDKSIACQNKLDKM